MTQASTDSWVIRGRALSLERPRIMGILNVTPDSFSDGGELTSVRAAVERGRQMVAQGAHILDVGGESTRPGAEPVSVEEELARVIPVVEALTASVPVPVSIDTRRAGVAREAVAAGASIVNDVSGLAFDPEMASVVSRTGAGLVLMHMRGTPADMQDRAYYDDVVTEVAMELGHGLERARQGGISPGCVVVDPGIGFAKSADHSLTLLRDLEVLVEALGHPVLVGPSRKSFLGALLGVPPVERVMGTAVACVLAVRAGARIVRVHDVQPVAHALRVLEGVTLGAVPTAATVGAP